MKKIVFLPLVLFSFLTIAQKITFKIPDDAKRIVFLGNSITYQGHYIAYIEAYYKLKYPDRELEFINVGLPSETVTQLSEEGHADGKFDRPKLQERLKRILKKSNPDFIFACYGINDGIYLPFDESRFDAFKKGMNWLNKRLVKEEIPVIYITPTIYEKEGDGAYTNVVDIYSNWLVSNMYTNDWNVLDIHTPLLVKVGMNRLNNPYYKFAYDGIHPTKISHWLMANQILISLEELERLQNTPKECFDTFSNGTRILDLVERKQVVQKDAWLTETGHKRPNMKVGLPMYKANSEIKVIDAEIEVLLEE